MGGDNPETREPRMAEGGTAGQKKQVDDSETRIKMDDLGKRSQTGTTGGSKSRAMSAIQIGRKRARKGDGLYRTGRGGEGGG